MPGNFPRTIRSLRADAFWRSLLAALLAATLLVGWLAWFFGIAAPGMK